MEQNNDNSNNNIDNAIAKEESDDHLPRVQEELDKLNYANESINNLELELEDSKKEYVRTIKESEEQLNELEKKLGSCVEKSRPYYEARMELNDAKEKYYLAKHRFETAQELYVAARNVQLYAEENLENCSNKNEQERETLIKILDIAKNKVNDTELSKQSSDIEQINAFKTYEEKKKLVEQLEKDLKRSIEKSKKYFEIKSSLNKELRFLFTKIEGLKSCLKEAKSAYQQSLNNLELISTEIHTQRQALQSNSNSSNPNNMTTSEKDNNTTNASKLNSPSTASNLSTSSSTNTSSSSSNNDENDDKDNETLLNSNNDVNDNNSNNEDFDVYFKKNETSQFKNDISLKPKKKSSTINRNNSQKLSQVLITDEDIENIGLDCKLKMYKNEITSNSNSRKTTQECLNENLKNNAEANRAEAHMSSPQPQPHTSPNSNNHAQQTSSSSSRPQFRVPALFIKK